MDYRIEEDAPEILLTLKIEGFLGNSGTMGDTTVLELLSAGFTVTDHRYSKVSISRYRIRNQCRPS